MRRTGTDLLSVRRSHESLGGCLRSSSRSTWMPSSRFFTVVALRTQAWTLGGAAVARIHPPVRAFCAANSERSTHSEAPSILGHIRARQGYHAVVLELADPAAD
jgi:hypothetical protein